MAAIMSEALFPTIYSYEDTMQLMDFTDYCATIMLRVHRTMAFNVQEGRVFPTLPIEYGLQVFDYPNGWDIEIRLVKKEEGDSHYEEGDSVYFAIAPENAWGTTQAKQIEMPTPDPKNYVYPTSPDRFLMQYGELFQWLINVWEAYNNLFEFKEAFHWNQQQAMVDLKHIMDNGGTVGAPIPEHLFEAWAGTLQISEAEYWLDVEYDEMNTLGEAFIPDWQEIMAEDDGEWSEFHSDQSDDDEPGTQGMNTEEMREAWTLRYVASLEAVNVDDIPEDKRRCPTCWLDFGETDEFMVGYEPPELPEDPVEAEAVILFQALPFDARRPNNDAVRTTCGHLFGYDCLVGSLAVSSLCPVCRVELRA